MSDQSVRKAKVVKPGRKFGVPIVTVANKQRAVRVSTIPPSLSTASAGILPASIAADTYAYNTEFCRRSVLFLDTRRVRANNMLAHEQACLPHNPLTALVQKWLHPMRVSRYVYSDRFNPWMLPFKLLAPHLRARPRGTALDNPWMRFEQMVGQRIVAGLDQYRGTRDHASEQTFKALYGR